MNLDLPDNKYAKRILEYMQAQKYRIRAYNIIYVEGVDPDTLKINDDLIDYWNDVRAVITDDGRWLLSSRATTEPGAWYTYNPMNPKGAARIAFGQYKEAWCFGVHGSYQQDALVQCGTISVYRDKDQNGIRTGDTVDVGDDFGVNQHTVANFPDMPPDGSSIKAYGTIGHWSAGCLVARSPKSHAKFMQINRDSGQIKFDTTVLDGTLLHKLGVLGNLK